MMLYVIYYNMDYVALLPTLHSLDVSGVKILIYVHIYLPTYLHLPTLAFEMERYIIDDGTIKILMQG